MSLVRHRKPLPIALHEMEMETVYQGAHREMRRDPHGVVHWVYANTETSWIAPCDQDPERPGMLRMRMFPHNMSKVEADTYVTCLGCIVRCTP